MITREQCERTRNHREMIKHPEWWPHSTVLPLTRPMLNINDPRRYGLYFVSTKPGHTIYLTVLGFPITERTPTEHYATIDALLEAGWEVD